jgi:putative N6-adenine-specific DNA methylase
MIAKTLTGLEDILAAELAAMGAREIKKMVRSVEFHGDMRLLYEANLRCRTATRILKPLRGFRIWKPRDLYVQVCRIKWSRYLDPESTIAVDSVVHNSRDFNNSMFAAQRVKDAICDQIRHRTGERPSVDIKNPDFRLNLHIEGDHVTLSFDSSGEPLGKRGYRTEAGEAPLSEMLAAGILALTGWDAASPFVDGMCGSGTIVIEAAMKARGLAPGLARERFGFMRWKDFDANLFRAVREELTRSARPNLPFQIVGSDIDAARIEQARANAKRAGVQNDIRFECKSFADQTPPEPPGVLVINPPYGERLTPVDSALEELYSSIGDTLKQRYAGYNAFVFTAALEAAKRIGLKPSRRFPLLNGALDCRLLRYEMYQGSRRPPLAEDAVGQTPEA